jgi:hypothetical protein
MKEDPLDDILNNPPPMPVVRAGSTPAKIQNRRENFIMMPMIWWERLSECTSAHTYHVAIFLLHLHWRNHRKPFKLANGMLKYDGVSQPTKWRALVALERLGLITVDGRKGKSPTIHVHLETNEGISSVNR